MPGSDWKETAALRLIRCLDDLKNESKFSKPADLVEELINLAPDIGISIEAKLTNEHGFSTPVSSRSSEIPF